jgi:hypothetical protein
MRAREANWIESHSIQIYAATMQREIPCSRYSLYMKLVPQATESGLHGDQDHWPVNENGISRDCETIPAGSRQQVLEAMLTVRSRCVAAVRVLNGRLQ